MAPRRCTEFVFQIAAMVSTAGAFIAALFVEIRFRGLSDVDKDTVERISDGQGHNELFVKTEAVAGLALASTGVAVLIGLLALIGRICNVRHNRSNRRIFFCLYLLYVVVCFLLFAGTGVLGVFTTLEWNDIVNATSSTVIENIRNSLWATSACCFLVALVYAVLEVVLFCCCTAVDDY